MSGLTASARPSLYWYLSEPVVVRIEVALISEDAIDPLLEVAFDTGAAGINRISLAEHGIEIAEDAEIEWSVAIVLDPALTEKLASASAEERIALYAENGLWYDAIEAVSALIDASPGEAAAFDRNRSR